jgi:hypothetical protein
MKVFRPAWLACAALVALAACSGGSHGGTAAGTAPSPSATNPVSFPLFEGSEVLSSHEWHQTITTRPGTGDNSVFAQGAGTYDGHDVVAGTQALMPSLETWLSDLDAHPPSGYTPSVQGNAVAAARTHLQDMGVDFAVFQRTENGKVHGVVVLAVDPKTLDAKAGPILGAIGKFKLLPQSFKDSIDAQSKKQTGFTVTELTNPDSPVGAAIAALDQLRDFGGRGVVLIDAIKQ